jgi:hypothetical protein
MSNRFLFAFFWLCSGGACTALAQSSDTLNLTKRDLYRQNHKPALASIFSMVIPGAGQIYNRKYWKAPIVWGALGVSIYFVADNQSQFIRFRDAYRNRINEIPQPEFDGYSAVALKAERDLYQRNRDFAAVLGLVGYLLNVVDATVDGHLFHFDVSDDLSLHWQPSAPAPIQGFQPGLTLTLQWRTQ